MSCMCATRYGEVGPNYHDWQEIYPELIVLKEKYLEILQEAKQVGTWVPWPEDHYAKDITGSENTTQHNTSNIHGIDVDDANEAEDGPEESEKRDGDAAWTVFPFLHTFPAYEESKMTWIKSTCDHCPITSSLIARIPNVRTALFSRMTPGCVLASHTGRVYLYFSNQSK